ncbi:MAG: amphi-Trp domain-containing protein [Halovenus sp.]|jgi:amphi-Trp domain-containing protein
MSQTDAGAEDETETERTLIREGRDFEQEYRLSAAEAGRFLIEIGEQLQEGEELTITGDEWKLPFRFGDPVELEVEFEGYDEQELEVEIEIPGTTDETAPSVE